MLGPVSDRLDPEFGTGANAQEVRDAIQRTVDYLTDALANVDPERAHTLLPIVEIAMRVNDARRRKKQESVDVVLTSDDIRVIRFALLRALESI